MLNVQDAKSMNSLCRFIKHNSKLVQLDLSHTGLSALMLKEFG
jgi:hypothetical protein